MKTSGFGTIQAWPLWQGDEVFYALEEKGRIRRVDDVWEVTTVHGSKVIVPVGIAVVAWEVVGLRAPKTPKVTPKAINDVVAAVFPHAEKLQLPLYKCDICKNSYISRAEAATCRRGCDLTKPSRGNSCALCGFPLEMHEGAEVIPGPVEIKMERVLTGIREGEFKDVPREMPTWTVVVPHIPSDPSDSLHVPCTTCRLDVTPYGEIEEVPHLSWGDRHA